MPLLLRPVVIAACVFASTLSAQSPAKRPMTFLDVQHLKQIGAPVPSADGRWMLYTLSTPDWKEAKRQTDIHLVSLAQGVPSTRQLTFTKHKNESSPRWSGDGSFFVFASNRDAPASDSGQHQLYWMRPDGGEARRITDAKEGVSTFAFSKDGKSLAYRSGKADEEQLYLLPVAGIDTAKPIQLTKGATAVGLALGAQQQADLLRHRRHAGPGREAAHREEVQRVGAEHGDSALQPVGARRGSQAATAPHQRHVGHGVQLLALR